MGEVGGISRLCLNVQSIKRRPIGGRQLKSTARLCERLGCWRMLAFFKVWSIASLIGAQSHPLYEALVRSETTIRAYCDATQQPEVYVLAHVAPIDTIINLDRGKYRVVSFYSESGMYQHAKQHFKERTGSRLFFLDVREMTYESGSPALYVSGRSSSIKDLRRGRRISELHFRYSIALCSS